VRRKSISCTGAFPNPVRLHFFMASGEIYRLQALQQAVGILGNAQDTTGAASFLSTG
jgi:hypothetical protein